jgi:transcription termination/antitermination protein NusG
MFPDIGIFLPKRRLSWRKKGKVIEIVKPLFGGYIFVLADLRRIEELDIRFRKERIKMWLLKTGSTFLPVSTEEMQTILKLTCQNDVVEPSEVMQSGDMVKIIHGPLVGLEGLITRLSKRARRITLKVTIAGEEKMLELDGKWIEKTS